MDIYLRLLGDLGLDKSVLIEENETVLNCDDQTFRSIAAVLKPAISSSSFLHFILFPLTY